MFVLGSNPNKPNRITTKDKDTNVQYHLDYARWIVSNSFDDRHDRWLDRIRINRKFYMNDQWILDEDTVAFLMDSTGQTRNRIKMRHNLIRPMVEQYRGNAVIMKINASVKNYSPMVINRREEKLSELVFKTRVAQEFPWFGEMLKKKDPTIGEDVLETQQIFENLYVDVYVPKMNALLKHVSKKNQFADKQKKVAENLATTGLAAMECFNHGGDRIYELLESEDVFWDRDARKDDMTDASFCGYMKSLDPTYINERFNLEPHYAVAIENYTVTQTSASWTVDTNSQRRISSYRIPTYNTFWRDTERCEMGYIMDEFGYPMIAKINYTYPGDDEPRYTDADLIEPPGSEWDKSTFGKNKKVSTYFDYVRFCRFVPGECIGTSFAGFDGAKLKESPAFYDIPLEHGRLDYQAFDEGDYTNPKFPVKFQSWGYIEGEVFSPIDDAIDPQRFINRVLSVVEQNINNSGGSGMVIDEDSIEPGTADKVYSDSKEGKPITVRTKGKGVPNTVGYYDNTPKAGIYNMFNIIPTIKQMMTDTSGINEGLKGESTGSDQLVGVTELLIQRGSLMQEPFYYAMRNLFLQMYQDAATVGKRFYCDRERELAIISGDDGVEILRLSKDFENEDFRCDVSQENSDELLKSQANQMLTIFYQTQMIDDRTFANLYNRSTPDEVTLALRSQVGLRIEAARRKAKEEAVMMQQTVEQQNQFMERERQDGINQQNQSAILEMSNQQNELNKVLAGQAAAQPAG